MSAARRTLIVGAGLAGAAVMLGLRALGIEVDSVEIRSQTAEPGTGLLLTGNALVALDALGVGGPVRAAGRRVSSVRFSDSQNRELFCLDVDGRLAWPDFVSIHRGALRRVLLDAAKPLHPRWDVTVDALEEGTSGVGARFSDGSFGEYDLVVGADGLHSRVRELVFGTSPLAPIAGFSGWRFLTSCPTEVRDPLYMLGNGRTLLLHPLAGGELYCGAGPAVDGALRGGGEECERLRATFAEFAGPARVVLDRLEAGTEIIPTRYWHVDHAPWHRGRCVLIGDAAHACAPTLAQGGAMALEDAVVLCELLALGREVEPTLAAFEERRRDRVLAVQRDSLARMESNRILPEERIALRNAVLRKLGARLLAAAWAPVLEQGP